MSATAVHPKGKGAWYFTSMTECVLCGRTRVYKERRHDERPDDPSDRYEYEQDACGDHFA